MSRGFPRPRPRAVPRRPVRLTYHLLDPDHRCPSESSLDTTVSVDLPLFPIFLLFPASLLFLLVSVDLVLSFLSVHYASEGNPEVR